ncbi:NAD(P)H-dependent D-xylose reductase I,II [Gracilariopsis chorda]|uniref:NAD(P)H-dependent D-xylose reductase I,II n=1 Tax=Gracilariopsis chorda TaxID=448386 RepID=A0A2V3J5Q9_9FLOR|nr:NAD(P)H-dependent D-xylose reductase I,II [Gracilariopsis chorda]|eukprot:PXF49745.1 NAD(P)H-dependent D-xylose reductase I,II [Gracilariopsis chorda]
MTGPSLPLVPSATSAKFPQLGLGTWKAPKGVASKIVAKAIELGYRAIDCACDYGNEQEVGEGIRNGLKAAQLDRESLFVTSKLWNTYHKPEHVRPACMKTLSDLGLDYLDLYMIHFPISLKFVPFEKRYPPEWVHDPEDPENATMRMEKVPLQDTWRALEALVDEGLIRHVGVCNFPYALLEDLLTYSRIRPSVLQIELHPYLQQPRLLQFCKREKIVVTAFSSFGATSYKELGMDRGHNLFEDDCMKHIARKHGKSVAQVALRWAVQRGTAIIPKTSKVERLVENMSVFDWELGEEDMKAIGALDRGLRYNDPGEFCVSLGMGEAVPIYD